MKAEFHLLNETHASDLVIQIEKFVNDGWEKWCDPFWTTRPLQNPILNVILVRYNDSPTETCVDRKLNDEIGELLAQISK